MITFAPSLPLVAERGFSSGRKLFNTLYMSHKAGYVNIIGKPNAGKSTVMNALTGEPVAIVTPKAQTTRHRILGVVNGPDHQIIYSDTPGIMEPGYMLHKLMMRFIDEAFEDADVLLVIQDAQDMEMKEEVMQKIKASGKPLLFLLNKIDLYEQELVAKRVCHWEGVFPHGRVVPVSALHKFNLDTVEKIILKELPLSPPYYEKDTLTDKPVRFFVAEFIREKILIRFRKEIPYSVEVEVDEYKDTGEMVRIRATVFVERESQRKIMIGARGNAIKGVGIDARKAIEKFTDKKVFLDLSVKVSKDWRNDEKKLKRFGYNANSTE